MLDRAEANEPSSSTRRNHTKPLQPPRLIVCSYTQTRRRAHGDGGRQRKSRPIATHPPLRLALRLLPLRLRSARSHTQHSPLSDARLPLLRCQTPLHYHRSSATPGDDVQRRRSSSALSAPAMSNPAIGGSSGPPVGIWTGLLKWSLAQHNVEPHSDVKPMSEEDKKFLRGVCQSKHSTAQRNSGSRAQSERAGAEQSTRRDPQQARWLRL